MFIEDASLGYALTTRCYELELISQSGVQPYCPGAEMDRSGVPKQDLGGLCIYTGGSALSYFGLIHWLVSRTKFSLP